MWVDCPKCGKKKVAWEDSISSSYCGECEEKHLQNYVGCKHGNFPDCKICEKEFEAAIKKCKADGGHKWEDKGWAGPNSGAIYMVCTLCGDEWHKILYQHLSD